MRDEPREMTTPWSAPQAILETALYCGDLAAAQEFYQQLLGLELISSEPGRHLFFRLKSGMLLIFNPDNTRQSTAEIDGQMIPRHGADGAGHIAFQVESDQLDSVRERLETFEVDIESAIDWPAGGQSIYCRDPAGNSVEFATRDLWY